MSISICVIQTSRSGKTTTITAHGELTKPSKEK